MFSLGLSGIFSRVLTRRRPSIDSEITRGSLPDSFNVGLTHDWSESSPGIEGNNKWYGSLYYYPLCTLSTIFNRTIVSYTSPSSSSTASSLLKRDPGSALRTPSSSSRFFANPLETPILPHRERDIQNEPFRYEHIYQGISLLNSLPFQFTDEFSFYLKFSRLVREEGTFGVRCQRPYYYHKLTRPILGIF